MTSMADYRIIHGDALAVLRTLPDASVHMVCTSPPYWGLRSYLPDGHDDKPLELGLERTPQEYVARLVEVFREVKRVLRPDGTIWLNLGSCYASGGMRSNQSRRESRDPACDSDGIGRQDSQEIDPACYRSDDARQGDFPNRLLRNSRIVQEPDVNGALPCMTVRDNGRKDYGPMPAGDVLPSVLPSTNLESSEQSQGSGDLSPTDEVYPLSLRSYAPDVQEYAHTGRNMRDRSRPLLTSVVHTSDTELSSTALGTSTDSIALTSLYHTIASLNWQAKQLIDIPHLVALALQCDGWILRADIVWAKRAPMPESVTDRPTRSHEQIFLLAKNKTYYYDNEAVKEAMADGSAERYAYSFGGDKNEHLKATDKPTAVVGHREPTNGRNQRDVWLLSPEPFAAAHFAVYPTEIPRRAILAGTSAHGCCPKCGAPWRRVLERKPNPNGITGGEHREPGRDGGLGKRNRDYEAEKNGYGARTIGWTPTCACGAGDPVPCIVLDPFLGSGTTLAVAVELGRHGIGIELNADYIELAHERVSNTQPPLLAWGP